MIPTSLAMKTLQKLQQTQQKDGTYADDWVEHIHSLIRLYSASASCFGGVGDSGRGGVDNDADAGASGRATVRTLASSAFSVSNDSSRLLFATHVDPITSYCILCVFSIFFSA